MSEHTKVDVLLIGGGIMSATLGALLARLEPAFRICMVEALDQVALESSDGWNNAGTGHAGYCELNYTPQLADGSIAIDRALDINAAFEVSLQLWSSLVEQQALPAPAAFINATPHMSFVWGGQDTAFLRQRHERLSFHPLFQDMRYSEDRALLAEWMPLVMQQRDPRQKVAATRVDYGADVDFGVLTRSLVESLQQQPNFELWRHHPVEDLEQQKNGRWQVRVRDHHGGASKTIDAGFVFLGAGGGTLALLQKSAIAESRGYGGFPVSGQWLVCNNPDIVQQHHAKVYGKAALGAPPMSVPHLDTRIINGRPALLFGPFAGFTTRFLKQGHWLDLLSSLNGNNLKSVLAAGVHNMDLTRYLVREVFQTHSERVASLRQFLPVAVEREWTLATAGQRVQIIKPCSDKGGKLEFGTEIVTSRDGTLAALLGASPGASTSVPAMLSVIERCFTNSLASPAWANKLQALVPSYGASLVTDAELLKIVRTRTLGTLGLGRTAAGR
jgi:malate dehydrogenase (quinone)